MQTSTKILALTVIVSLVLSVVCMVKVFSGGRWVSLPEWYDRNPLQVGNSWLLAGTGVHVPTVRFTYTVPAGRKAMVESIQLFLLVDAAGVGSASAFAIVQPGGGAGITLLYDIVQTNVLGERESVTLGASFMLLPTDVFTLNTQLAGLGTATIFVGAKITEFDL